MSDRHAYLIMAHNNWNQLSVLLSLLDDIRNDIYLHIDKKSGAFPKEILCEKVKKSSLYFIPRKKVYWGDYSQVEVELALMEVSSSREHYRYYHLLSGLDLPLKSQEEIHAFFKNESHEFIPMIAEGVPEVEEFICYYHLPLLIRNQLYKNNRWVRGLDKGLVYIQRFLGLKRVYEKDLVIAKGWQWFSITDDFCRYVLSQKSLIRKLFSFTRCSDENVMGTMVNKLGNHDMVYHVAKIEEGENNLQSSCLRYIDFGRTGKRPYIWGRDDADKDFEELMNSGMLFARKFDENVNKEIIERVAVHILKGINPVI